MNGILIIDKPADWTSFDVIAKLRGMLKEKRIGHGGTLDPMATGVLPVFVGRATRAAEFCENAEKEYVAGLRLGLVTDTQDTTGQTLSEHAVLVTKKDLEAVLPRFLGAQMQIPPMYSAIKQDGRKLYELARKGVEVPRPARGITIPTIELLDGGGSEYVLRVVCSKGTYIRTLCHDIGAALGCGGVMSSLRRTRAGAFSIDMAHTLDEIQSAVSTCQTGKLVKPVDSLFSEYPSVSLDEAETRKVKNGIACNADGLSEGKYRFYGPGDEFLLLGESTGGAVKAIKRFYSNSES